MAVWFRSRAALSAALAAFVVVSVNFASPPGTPLDDAEFVANPTVAGDQTQGVVARDADGDSVVVWTSGGDIYFQRYDYTGAAQGAETRANSDLLTDVHVAGLQGSPAVAMDASGIFAIAWESATDSSGTDIIAQRFAADGSLLGANFVVNTTRTNNQIAPAIGMAADGRFVIAWQGQDASGGGIFARTYSSAGVGDADVQVNTTTANGQVTPAVAMAADGDYVVVWDSNNQGSDSGHGIFGRFNDGGTFGSEFHANDSANSGVTAGDQVIPAVAIAGNSSGFVVTWQGPEPGTPTDTQAVYAQRYNATGVATGSNFKVNTTTTADQISPRIAADFSGDFVIVWEDVDTLTDSDVFMQRYNAAGAAQGGETALVATALPLSNQNAPNVALDADGDFIAVWQSDESPTDGYDILARRFVGFENVDVALTMTDAPDPVETGAPYSYVLTVTNNHGSAATGIAALDAAIGQARGLRIKDTLPTGAVFTGVDAAGSTAGWTCGAGTGADLGSTICTFANGVSPVAGSNTAILKINVTAPMTEPATGQSEVTNTASVTIDQNDPDAANDTDVTEATAVCADASPSSVQFSSATFTQGEAGPNATISVSRTGGTCGQATVAWQTSNDNPTASALAGTDYTASSGSVSFDTGDGGPASFTVALTNDNLDEDNETFTVALQNPVRAVVGSPSTASVEITDNDTAEISMAITPTTLTEDAGASTSVTVSLSNPTITPVDVTLDFGGTANLAASCPGTFPDDYCLSGGLAGSGNKTIRIPQGQTTTPAGNEILVTPHADPFDEPNETVTLILNSFSGHAADNTPQTGGANPAVPTMTLSDDDATPTVAIADATLDPEGAVGTTNLPFAVTLSAPSARTVTLNYATADGSATQPGDYTDSSGQVTFPATTSPTPIAVNTTQTINVPVAGDSLDEGNETFNLSLTVLAAGASNATLSDGSAVGTITDDDAVPTVDLTVTGSTATTPTTANINETGIGAGAQATVTATLSTASGRAITIPLTFSGAVDNGANRASSCGTAQNPADYSCSGASITIAAGSTTGTVTITSATDTLYENVQTVPPAASAAVAEGLVVAADCPANSPTVTYQCTDMTEQVAVTIDENDAAPTLTFDPSSAPTFTGNASEAAGNQSIVVQMSLGAGTTGTEHAIAVPYTVAGTASAGVCPLDATQISAGKDFCATPVSSLSFAATTNPTGTQNIVLSVNNDATNESDETVQLALGSTLASSGSKNYTHTITNDDALPQISFAAAASSKAEGTGGTSSAIIRVNMSRPDDAGLDTNVPFSLMMAMTGAAQANDYGTFKCRSESDLVSSDCSGSATIVGGDSFAEIEVPVTTDNVDEDAETVTIALGTPSRNTLVDPSTHVLTITDDDTAAYTINDVTVTEGNSGSANATFTVTRTPADHETTTDYATANGTATSGSDYTSTSGSGLQTMTFPASTSNSNMTIDVPVTGDTVDESNETYTVVLSNPTSATSELPTYTDGTGLGTITDNDTASYTIDDVTVTEGNSGSVNATFTVTRTAADHQTTVDYATADGTATAGSDYTAIAATTLTFAANTSNSTQTFNVSVTGDVVDEANETYLVNLGNPGSAAAELPTIADNQGTGTITDNDTTSYTIDDVTVTEGDSGTVTATFTVTRTASEAATTIDYTTAGVTATEGTDYADATGALAMPGSATTSTGTIAVTINGDLVDEDNETYTVTLSNASAGGTIADATGAGTITDDDTATLSVADAAVTEGTGSGTTTLDFVVSLSTASSVTVTVNYATADATATQPSDYASASGTLTFTPGQTTQTVPVTVARDARDEAATETLTLQLSGESGASVTDGSATGTITDDDTVGITIIQPGGSTAVAEGGGSDTYTVELASQPTANVTITLTPNAQVTAGPTTLTFTPADWNVAQFVTVNAVDDSAAEGNHTGSVAHAATSADAAYEGLNGSVTVDVADNDAPGIIVTQSGGSTAVTEGGTTDTYSIVLTSQPSANVTITVNAGTQLTTNPTSATFTSANWNVAQAVTVTAVNDLVAEGPHTGAISHAASSSDAAYNGVAVTGGSFSVNITDNDTAGVTITQSGGFTAVSESGANDTYTIVLTSQPTANVTIAINAGTQVTTAPTSATFTAANWNTAQTVTIAAVNDTAAEGSHNTTVTHSASSSDTRYSGIAVSGVSVSITDNDQAGINAVESGGSTSVVEGGSTDSVAVTLTSQPTANVTITAQPGTQLTTSPRTLTFTPANWNVAQIATIAAVDDTQVEGTHTANVGATVSSADAAYNNQAVNPLVVTITDNDSVTPGEEAPGVVVTPSGNVASGGGGGAFSWAGLLPLLALAGLRRRKTLAAVLALSSMSAFAQTVTIGQPQSAPPAEQAPAQPVEQPAAQPAAQPVPAPAQPTPAPKRAPVAPIAVPAPASRFSYNSMDLRYLTVKVDDPSVDANGFALAGSWAMGKRLHAAIGYSAVETDEFRAQGVVGASETTTIGLSLGMHLPLKTDLDMIGALNVLSAKAEGQGGFKGSSDDTGFGLEGGLRGLLGPRMEWTAAVSWVSIFGDNDTALTGQTQWHLGKRFGLLAGLGIGSNATQLNIGGRYNF